MGAPALVDVAMGDAIPRILWQTCPKSILSGPLRGNIDELGARNPDWDHRLYDDDAIETFIERDYGRAMLRHYRRINPEYGAARADFFRYLALYRWGGVYLDVKSRFTRPIDEVIRPDDRFLLSQWQNGPGEPHEGWGLHDELADVPGGEFQQWHIVAAPGHPFLRAVLERVIAGISTYSIRHTGVGWSGVLRLTGPIAYTRAIVPLLDRYPCRRVADERALSLEYSVLERSKHQGLFARHYVGNTSPVARRPGIKGFLERRYVQVQAFGAHAGDRP